ncbi:MAG: hypothetical protein ABIJ08_03270 [Nanoarchaeota archaeon]
MSPISIEKEKHGKNKMAICDLVDTTQTEGVFGIPEGINIEVESAGHTHPIIIIDETYFLFGINGRLKGSKYQAKRLFDLGLLRKKEEGEKGSMIPLDTLSLAQIVSFCYKQPIERILKTSQEVKEIASKLPIRRRLDYLFSAYYGISWFESFKNKFMELVEKQGINQVPEHRDIILRRVGDYLFTPYKNGYVKQLEIAGFLGLKRELPNKRGASLVDNESLAYLICKLTGLEPEVVYKKEISDLEAASLFLNQHIIPFMQTRKIEPNTEYNLLDAAALSGKGLSSLKKDACRGDLTARKKDGIYVSTGFDLSVYCLKKGLDVGRYKVIVDLARSELNKEYEIQNVRLPGETELRTLFLSANAIDNYCRLFYLDKEKVIVGENGDKGIARDHQNRIKELFLDAYRLREGIYATNAKVLLSAGMPRHTVVEIKIGSNIIQSMDCPGLK